MAKTLRPILCPQCGSPDKTTLGPDLYRCNACQTEYYLDSDDVTVHVRHHYAAPPPRPVPAPTAARYWVASIFLLVALGALTWLYFLAFRPRQPSMAGGSAAAADSEPAALRQPRWMLAHSVLLPGAGQRPVLVVAGDYRSLSGNAEETPTVICYDATTGTVLKKVVLPGKSAGHGLTDLHLKQLSNGDTYVLYHNAVYQVSAAPPAVADVTQALLGGQRALASGVANLDVGNNEGDHFYIFTNDGHQLSFYPLIRRIYTDDEQWDASHDRGPRLPGSRVRTAFAFTQRGMQHRKEPIQLLTYQYRDNGGGPSVRPEFAWQDDYGGYGVFTSADPHQKTLIARTDAAISRVLSYRDFTPGRHYFAPYLLHYDADYVLLTSQATAAASSSQLVQLLDAHTGAIVFTTALPAAAPSPTLALRYPGGFVIGHGQTTYTLSPTGKLGPAVTAQ
ncbi:hypothetical protein FNT36_14210 [Hymenobacter setariae]|uniref:Uncharacterized protein n=1 Tax=Hymenobacter setariae TaxID=2594794 RepID=A0A558BVT8_9BACT|nr:hypothetical protein [Hymenobacter setariae]TVT40619.1 hypothetical protein FNT36_14210 [Hymenobacter setariae]